MVADIEQLTKQQLLDKFNPMYVSVEAMMPSVPGRYSDSDLYYAAMLRALADQFKEHLSVEQMATIMEAEAQHLRNPQEKQ